MIQNQNKKIFIIAGEKSGDNIGGKLIKELKLISAKNNSEIDISGIGGSLMIKQGLNSLFDMREINLFGFLEVLPHILKLQKRIEQTVAEILKFNPDAVVTIDSPGFNFRVAKKLKEQNFKGKLVHYVAPSVWAYKPERAAKTASIFSHLLTILPWENKYFEKEGLACTFVGHPVFEDIAILSHEEKSELKQKLKLDSKTVIGVIPGSRKGEIKRLLPEFLKAVEILKAKNQNIEAIILPTEEQENLVNEIANKTLGGKYKVISNHNDKISALQICDGAIVKSGTVALEVARVNVPHVVAYKVNSFSAWMLKKMMLQKYVNLVNISAQKEIIPELIQENCNAGKIAIELGKILSSETSISNMKAELSQEISKLDVNNIMPSHLAAQKILSLIGS